MQNKIKQRRIATQFSQDHDHHLCIELNSYLPAIHKQVHNVSQQIINNDAPLQTNYNWIVNNPYAFILLHLRNKKDRNIINIKIPQTCIFIERAPYDIVYSQNGYIKGHKSSQNSRMSLKQLYRYYKASWTKNNLSKNEQCLAVFAGQQKLMLSDNDFYLVCCKTKIDPYFRKLRYIKNKIPQNNSLPLICKYPPAPLPLKQGQMSPKQINYLKLATQSLLSIKDQQYYRQILSEQIQYLNYLNEKICLFLNYQQNIRVKSAKFVYLKTYTGQYYLWDVSELKFDNLTKALHEREKYLKQKQQQKQKILELSPQKQAKYRSHLSQKANQIKNFQKIMTNQFNSIVHKLNLNTMSDNRRQQVKNQLAFKRLHPRSKFTYNQVVTSDKFIQTKNKLFNISTRKQLTVPSKQVMRFYNKVKNPRMKTQTIDVWKSKYL